MTLSPLIVGIACLLLGLVVGLLIKSAKVRKINQEIEREEQAALLRLKDLERLTVEQQAVIDKERNDWDKTKNEEIITLSKQEADLRSTVSGLESQIEEKRNSISTMEEQTKEAVKSFEEQIYDLMSTEFAQKATVEIDHCKYLSEEAQKEYERVMQESMEYYTSHIDELVADYERITAQLQDAREKADAAVEVNKRAELERQEKDFYRLQLSDIDVEEIKRIRSIEPYLRKKEPLNKVIWKVYYEKPYTDLIGRVVGQGKKTGIYKITNLENGMCYVGQAVDIADRWKQHIKRGVGADPPTQNKLYPAMLEIGVENFTFEIIEQCDGNKLSEREQYWQNFYHAKDFGYSIK